MFAFLLKLSSSLQPMWEEKLRLMYKVMKLIYYNFVLYVSYDTMIHSVIKIRCEIMKIKYI